MRLRRQPPKWLKVAACLCCFQSGGCMMMALGIGNAFHMTAERTFTPRVERVFCVRDGDTGEAVPNARLTIVHNFDWMDDWESSKVTGQDGCAKFGLATQYKHLLYASVQANGYYYRDFIRFDPDDEPIGITIDRLKKESAATEPAGTGRRSVEKVGVNVRYGP
jgi:hypothetical protein